MNSLKTKLFKRQYSVQVKNKISISSKLLCIYTGVIVGNGVYEGFCKGLETVEQNKKFDDVFCNTYFGMINGAGKAMYSPILIPIYSYHYMRKE